MRVWLCACGCVQVVGGMLEVWVAPLQGGAWAVSLFNRSPGADTITVTWANLGVPATASFSVKCVGVGVGGGGVWGG